MIRSKTVIKAPKAPGTWRPFNNRRPAREGVGPGMASENGLAYPGGHKSEVIGKAMPSRCPCVYRTRSTSRMLSSLFAFHSWDLCKTMK